MKKGLEDLTVFYKLLDNQGLKNDFDKFIQGYGIENYLENQDMIPSQILLENENGNALNIYLERYNISLNKYDENQSENLIIYNNLYSYLRKVEKTEDGIVYSILQKKYDSLGNVEYVVDQIYRFSHEKLQKLLNYHRCNFSEPEHSLMFFRSIEARGDLKHFVSKYTEYTRNNINNSTYINGQKIDNNYQEKGKALIKKIKNRR